MDVDVDVVEVVVVVLVEEDPNALGTDLIFLDAAFSMLLLLLLLMLPLVLDGWKIELGCSSVGMSSPFNESPRGSSSFSLDFLSNVVVTTG